MSRASSTFISGDIAYDPAPHGRALFYGHSKTRQFPLLAQSVGAQGVEFTSAFGRAAEMRARTASAAFDEMTLKRHARATDC